jgi:large subunit ribosomal protein L15
MSVKKRKKTIRMRGSKTHGGGSMKKRRGAGNRGGRGRAGYGKRACQKMPRAYARGEMIGKCGFVRQGLKNKIAIVNLNFFEVNAEKLLAEKKIEKSGDVYIIDSAKLGFDKILGSGKLSLKLRVKAPSISKKAEEKIKTAGGEIVKAEVPKEA